MPKSFAHIMSATLTIAALLCLSACDGSEMTIENGVASVLVETMGATGSHDRQTIIKRYEDFAQKLQKTKKPFHKLVVNAPSGQIDTYDVPLYFVNIADKIQELVIDGQGGISPSLVEYKNLGSLHVKYLKAHDDSAADKNFVDILRACPSLRNLSFGKSGSTGHYSFSKQLKSSGLLINVNGQPLADWNPVNDLDPTDDSQRGFTVDAIRDAFETERESYTPSSEPPPVIRGKIIVGESKNSEPIRFKYSYTAPDGRAFRDEYHAATPAECAAVVIVHSTYEEYGTYSDGTKGYIGRFHVQVIDLVNKTIYTSAPFEPKEPPARKNAQPSIPNDTRDRGVYPIYRDSELIGYLKTIIETAP